METTLLDKILDLSIYFSFDKSGFLRHQKEFSDSYIFKSNSQALITGGSSGIGLATALELTQQKVNVWFS